METVIAERKNSNKPQVSFIFEARHALEGVAKVLEFGSKKYSRGNWRKGLHYLKTIDSLGRHLIKFTAGEELDLNPETGKADENYSGLPHVDLILCNALFLAEHYRTHKELDDRVKSGT